MDQSTSLAPQFQAVTNRACSHCGKTGHHISRCWVKHPEQKTIYIENLKRHGKYKKQGSVRPSDGGPNQGLAESSTSNVPIQINQVTAGPSRIRAHEPSPKVDSKGTPPRAGAKAKHSRSAPKNKRAVAWDTQPELLYFVPNEMSSLPRKPKTTSLNDLPDELVLKIIEHFNPCQHVADRARGKMDLLMGDTYHSGISQDRQNLRMICLTSRRVFGIARPILGSLVRDTGSLSQRLRLIQRFIHYPVAASHVRVIFVEGLEKRSSKMRPTRIRRKLLLAASEVDIGEQETQDSPTRERFRTEDWKRHIKEDGNDARVAMLLSLLPKLEILHLSVRSCNLAEDFPWTLALMRRAGQKHLSPGSGPFSTLHTLLTTDANPEVEIPGFEIPGFSPYGLACALGLPTLRFVSVYYAWSGATDSEDSAFLLSRAGIGMRGGSCRSKIDWPTAVSSLETLIFEDSILDSEYLRNALAACKSLRHFTLKWPMEMEVDCSGAEVGYSGLLESLKIQKHSLETLVLNSADVDWFGRWENPGLTRIGSFAKFDKLRTIEIGGEHIIGGVPPTNPLGDTDSDSEIEDSSTYEVNGRPLDYHQLADIFPPSLEKLIFNSPGQSDRLFMPLIVEIARACKLEERLPKLKTVDAEQCLVEGGFFRHQALLDQAKGFFTDAGITFLPPDFLGSEDEDGMYPTYWGGSDDGFGYDEFGYGSGYNYDYDEWSDEDEGFGGFM
ncbi:hypothetical protein FKW77_006366 [Venturia effusa]|uniref:CCHC-type domain-containing protein n=1 Tax=Venturia effusa TaxID=50376 RepID=A0A517L1G8_9PEZI|nr:hypothetical protein FKW77_006366 [Venturia effusa]